MSQDAIERWMHGYQRAWTSNDPGEITALFTEEAEYRSYPWAEPAIGHDAIAALWQRTADQPGDHDFSWSLVGTAAQLHIVQGRTRYADGRVYENLWLVRLTADGRARSFTEWYMESESKVLGPGGAEG